MVHRGALNKRGTSLGPLLTVDFEDFASHIHPGASPVIDKAVYLWIVFFLNR